jgi:ATP-binding cassette subfamily B protein
VRNLFSALCLPWRCAPALAAFQLAETVSTGLVPVAAADLAAALIDSMTGGRHGRDAIPLTIAVIAVTAAGALLQYASGYAAKELARRIGLRTQQDLFGAVTAIDDLAELENPDLHNQIRLAQQAATIGPQQLSGGILAIMQGAITTGGFLISCLTFAPVSALLLVVSAVPGVAAQWRLSRARARATVAAAPYYRRQIFYTLLLIDLRAAKEIRLFGLGPRLLHRMRAETEQAQRLDRAVDRATLRADGSLSLLTAAASGAALILVVASISKGRTPVGELAVLIAALAAVQTGIAGMVSQAAGLSQTLSLFTHYTALVGRGHGAGTGAGIATRPPAAPAEVPPATPPVALAAARLAASPLAADDPNGPGIRFESVWFRYHAEAPWVLRGLNLHLPDGTLTGLVGLNGAGKSTIAKLLCRLYEPTRGRITWDGTDIRDLPLPELRGRISAVYQDFMTYELPAHDNIALGSPDPGTDAAAAAGFGVSRQAVTAAASAAGIDELIGGLPAGYDSMFSRIFASDSPVSPSGTLAGVQLSGGQWQRVALARAAMRPGARLLILDEPSASLDPLAEADQRERLRDLLTGKIGLLISHRLDGIRRAGLIIVLRDGQLIEQGSHNTLMLADGEYARLFRLQAEAFLGQRNPDDHGALAETP